MGSTSIQPAGSFIACDNAGREYEIFIFRQDREIGSPDGANGAKWKGRLKTLRGHEVNRLAPGRYEIVGDGVPPIMVKSDDPSAP